MKDINFAIYRLKSIIYYLLLLIFFFFFVILFLHLLQHCKEVEAIKENLNENIQKYSEVFDKIKNIPRINKYFLTCCQAVISLDIIALNIVNTYRKCNKPLRYKVTSRSFSYQGYDEEIEEEKFEFKIHGIKDIEKIDMIVFSIYCDYEGSDRLPLDLLEQIKKREKGKRKKKQIEEEESENDEGFQIDEKKLKTGFILPDYGNGGEKRTGTISLSKQKKAGKSIIIDEPWNFEIPKNSTPERLKNVKFTLTLLERKFFGTHNMYEFLSFFFFFYFSSLLTVDPAPSPLSHWPQKLSTFLNDQF
jgi:hypothetical protein